MSDYEEYYLGIDGGQSHTTALIADANGFILGRGLSGPSNHTRGPGGRERLERAVSESVSDALREAGLMERGSASDFYFHSAHLAMTGEPEGKREVIEHLLSAEHLVVGHDAPGALSGALAGQTGIIVLAGTGSVAYGEMQVNQNIIWHARIGGHGYLFGDEGSGFWIGKESLRLALHLEDRDLPEGEAFRTALLTHFKRDSLKSLAEDFYADLITRDQLASFTMRVDRLARQSDEIALGFLQQAAAHLAELAEATALKLGATRRRVQVSYSGGVFNSKLLLRHFKTRVKELLPKAQVVAPHYGPDIGALLLAYRNAEKKITKQLLKNLNYAD
ncbi:MAG TPA: BadF/BadG/BcrA/BcrD ATPase family protein [Blastocatellia bacterium]|nr:BadF/BadG/BcrA/BcrD ATPase family protein [Blastocatellia bacterium]